MNIESHHYVENGIQETCMSHQFGTHSVISRVHTFQLLCVMQWRRNRNAIGGAGVRGSYPWEASACEGKKIIS